MGATGSGRTTFINSASGSHLRVGRGLQSCTSDVQAAPQFELDGRSVVLIDMPGFDDTAKSDAEILRLIAAFLVTTYQHGMNLAGVIYIHRISDFRMDGVSTRNFKMFRQLCGESTLRNVVILTNMWGEVSREVGEAREQELATQDKFFKPVLDKGGQLLRHDNTQETALNVLTHIVENHPLALQIQEELVDQKKDISDTVAGEELYRELQAQLRKHREELKILQEEINEAIRTKDEEFRRVLESETKKLQTELNRVQTDAQRSASEYNVERRGMENMDQLRAQLQKASDDSVLERQKLHQEIQELRNRRPGGGCVIQ